MKYATGFFNGVTVNTGSYLQDGRHTEGANYVMADGHAKFLRPAAVSPGYNASSDTARRIDPIPPTSAHRPAAGSSGYFPMADPQPAATFSVP